MTIKDYCTGIQHIGVPTNHLQQTIEFYEKLGFTLILRTDNRGEQVAFLRMHDVVIETYQNGAATLREGAIDHIALNVKQIESLFELVKTNGFELLDRQVNQLPFWEHGVKFFTIVGPNREKIEFCERIE